MGRCRCRSRERVRMIDLPPPPIKHAMLPHLSPPSPPPPQPPHTLSLTHKAPLTCTMRGLSWCSSKSPCVSLYCASTRLGCRMAAALPTSKPASGWRGREGIKVSFCNLHFTDECFSGTVFPNSYTNQRHVYHLQHHPPALKRLYKLNPMVDSVVVYRSKVKLFRVGGWKQSFQRFKRSI